MHSHRLACVGLFQLDGVGWAAVAQLSRQLPSLLWWSGVSAAAHPSKHGTARQQVCLIAGWVETIVAALSHLICR